MYNLSIKKGRKHSGKKKQSIVKRKKQSIVTRKKQSIVKRKKLESEIMLSVNITFLKRY